MRTPGIARCRIVSQFRSPANSSGVGIGKYNPGATILLTSEIDK